MNNIVESDEIGIIMLDEDGVRVAISEKYPDLEFDDVHLNECVRDIEKQINTTGLNQILDTVVQNNVTLLHDRLTNSNSVEEYESYEEIMSKMINNLNNMSIISKIK